MLRILEFHILITAILVQVSKSIEIKWVEEFKNISLMVDSLSVHSSVDQRRVQAGILEF